MSTLLDIIIGMLAMTGAMLFLASGIALHRTRGAICRINSQGTAVGFGTPLILASVLIFDAHRWGFSWWHFIEVILAGIFCLVVPSIGSMILGRASVISKAPLDPRTRVDAGPVPDLLNQTSRDDAAAYAAYSERLVADDEAGLD